MADEPIFNVDDAPAHLRWGDNAAELRCRIWIDRDGSAHWQAQPVVLLEETKWLMPLQIPEAITATPISFTAEVTDGGIFSSDYAYIHSHKPGSIKGEPDTVAVGGGFSHGKIVYSALPAETKDLRVTYRVAGMKGFKIQAVETPVGRVLQQGPSEIENYSLLCGSITVEAPPESKPAEPWLEECEKMARKILDLLSLAQGKFFPWRIRQIGFGEKTVEIEFLGAGSSEEPQWPVFHYLNLAPALDLAVNHYTDELCEATGLPIALEWFVHQPHYSELKLTTLVTALERLVSVENHDKKDPKLIAKDKFKKLRAELEASVQNMVKEHPQDKDALENIGRKIGGLNSSTLRDKIDRYLAHFNVPMANIKIDDIYAVVGARNDIIHDGHYDSTESNVRLHQHVATLRELVLRIFLTHLGFKGRYMTFLNGYEWDDFPPVKKEKAPQKPEIGQGTAAPASA